MSIDWHKTWKAYFEHLVGLAREVVPMAEAFLEEYNKLPPEVKAIVDLQFGKKEVEKK